MANDTLAIDFGTSNTAVAVLHDGKVRRIPIEGSADTLPTAVFFPDGPGAMLIGAEATEALIAGDDGRYMRALKSVLGLPLLHEEYPIGGRMRSLASVITDYLIELRERAERATGQTFRQALSGRPVHFHDDPKADIRAEEDLRQCYVAAGFDNVDFLAEPEAAALAAARDDASRGIGLIVDIGGGTSDFTVFRGSESRPEIIASHGIRLGGTNFDHDIAMSHVMPRLGLGGQLRRVAGAGLTPVPVGPYSDLATWARIPFLYNAATRRMVREMVSLAVDRQSMQRLATVINQRLGHDLAFAVEAGKIAANETGGAAAMDLSFIETDLSEPIASESMDAALTAARMGIRNAISETLENARVPAADIGQVILVGGSSLMSFVESECRAICADAAIIRSNAFTIVVDGLALAGGGMKLQP